MSNEIRDGLIEDNITKYRELIDTIIRTTGSGRPSTRFQDTFYGMNRLNQLPELPIHMETQGMILFTRPDLNLNPYNISKVRGLSHLLDEDPDSITGAIRLMLDPSTQRNRAVMMQTQTASGTTGYSNEEGIRSTKEMASKLVDPYNPYLNLLGNTCITMNPPPDLGVNLYTSPEGKFKEQWIMADSITEYSSYYDLTCTFSNIQGNAVTMLLLTWLLYIGYLRIGDVGPHAHNLFRNRIDYTTRIERYKFDSSNRVITSWFHTGYSVLKDIGIGETFGLNRLEPYEFANKELSAQFGNVGAVYNDPIQLFEFNTRMMRWNPYLREGKRKTNMVKLKQSELPFFNNYGYPLIDLATNEMQWFVTKEEYAELDGGLESIFQVNRLDIEKRIDHGASRQNYADENVKRPIITDELERRFTGEKSMNRYEPKREEYFPEAKI